MKTCKLKINNKSFTTLVCETDKEKENGLMHIQPPPPIMCFPYEKRNLSFWMKNTPSPLDIIFCLENKISKIKQGEPYRTDLIHGGISDLVIEMPQGSCDKYGFKVGDSVILEE